MTVSLNKQHFIAYIVVFFYLAANKNDKKKIDGQFQLIHHLYLLK
jgi:hypothetical protein